MSRKFVGGLLFILLAGSATPSRATDLGSATDPATFERLRRARPGFHGMVGMERRMSKHIGMTADGSYHYIMAKDEKRFPSGYNGDKAYAQVRLGVTFFFSLSEKIDTGLPE